MSVDEPTNESEIDHTLIVYVDGSEQLAPARVGDIVAFETERGRAPDTTSIADVLWLVHRSLGQPDEFQAWADRVRKIVSNRDEVEEAKERLGVPPTGAAAGAP